jgi:lipopolysaccharide biosynthesis glycosyltransferase
VDDRYVPYLCVALSSLKAHASVKHEYDINVLIDTLSDENKKILCDMAEENIKIKFVNVQTRLEKILARLHMRDYYTQATYYRFFIPAMFEEYDRGVYLDCDIVITDDIAKLYHCALGTNLVAAVPDEIITDIDVFGRYSEVVLGIPRYEYFNAGILVMNLAEMRRINIEQQFADLLSQRTYRVAQDQDYLNVLCYNKTLLLNKKWNKTPMPGSNIYVIPKIAHYKINFKPWRYDTVPYAYLFWKYAKNTCFYELLLDVKANYTKEEMTRDSMQYAGLVNLAIKETEDASDDSVAEYGDMILAEA